VAKRLPLWFLDVRRVSRTRRSRGALYGKTKEGLFRANSEVITPVPARNTSPGPELKCDRNRRSRTRRWHLYGSHGLSCPGVMAGCSPFTSLLVPCPALIAEWCWPSQHRVRMRIVTGLYGPVPGTALRAYPEPFCFLNGPAAGILPGPRERYSSRSLRRPVDWLRPWPVPDTWERRSSVYPGARPPKRCCKQVIREAEGSLRARRQVWFDR